MFCRYITIHFITHKASPSNSTPWWLLMNSRMSKCRNVPSRGVKCLLYKSTNLFQRREVDALAHSSNKAGIYQHQAHTCRFVAVEESGLDGISESVGK